MIRDPRTAASRNRRLGIAVLAICLGAVNAPLAWGQLHSRPAAVVLIANLESLSVSARFAPSFPGTGPAETDLEQVAVSTSWAIPAHRTTLRLFGGLLEEEQAVSAGKGAQGNGSVAVPSQRETDVTHASFDARGTATLRSGDAGQALMSQGAESNRADSRTNLINLDFGRKSSSKPGIGADTTTFSIRMEAL
jgi:hypothetical protein